MSTDTFIFLEHKKDGIFELVIPYVEYGRRSTYSLAFGTRRTPDAIRAIPARFEADSTVRQALLRGRLQRHEESAARELARQYGLGGRSATPPAAPRVPDADPALRAEIKRLQTESAQKDHQINRLKARVSDLEAALEAQAPAPAAAPPQDTPAPTADVEIYVPPEDDDTPGDVAPGAPLEAEEDVADADDVADAAPAGASSAGPVSPAVFESYTIAQKREYARELEIDDQINLRSNASALADYTAWYARA